MNCSQVDELAPFYVAAVLSPRDSAEVEAHLEGCERHRALMLELRAIASIPPSSVDEVKLPWSLKGRIMAAIRQDAKPARRPPSRVRRYAPAVALAIVLFGLVAWNLDLQFRSVQAPDAFAIRLDGDEMASARLVYIGSQESGMLVSQGLPELPADRAYQMWAVTRKGLESRGLLTVDDSGRGFATISGDLDAVRPIFVTVEPAGGSLQPSGPRVLSTRR